MENYKTFAETKALLKTAIGLPGSSIKDIAAATGIKVSTLYKWNSGNAHLSPTKADKLLLYFMEKEPNRLEMADLVQTTSTSALRGVALSMTISSQQIYATLSISN